MRNDGLGVRLAFALRIERSPADPITGVTRISGSAIEDVIAGAVAAPVFRIDVPLAAVRVHRVLDRAFPSDLFHGSPVFCEAAGFVGLGDFAEKGRHPTAEPFAVIVGLAEYGVMKNATKTTRPVYAGGLPVDDNNAAKFGGAVIDALIFAAKRSCAAVCFAGLGEEGWIVHCD